MVRHPPDILITTPESLYLMLTSQAREIFDGAEQVIVDEIHAVAQTKRGAHLALTLERLAEAGGPRRAADRAVGDAEPARGGRPLPRRPEAHVHDRRHRHAQAARPEDPRAGRVDGRARAAPSVELDPFAGGRRRRASRSGRRSTRSCCSWSASTARRSSSSTTAARAERLALRLNELRPTDPRPIARAPPRLARARGAAGRRGAAQGRRAAVPGRDLVARARHRHGRGRPRAPGRVAEVGHRRAAADRPRRPRRRRHVEGPHLPQVPRRPARVRGRRAAHARGPDRDAPSCRATRSTCSPSRSSRSRRRPRTAVAVDELHALVTRTYSFAELSRAAARERARHARRPLPVGGVRRAARRASSGTASAARSARARAPARWRSPTPARSPTAGCSPSTCPTAAASASSTRRWSTRRGRARCSCSARRAGGSRRSRATA